MEDFKRRIPRIEAEELIKAVSDAADKAYGNKQAGFRPTSLESLESLLRLKVGGSRPYRSDAEGFRLLQRSSLRLKAQGSFLEDTSPSPSGNETYSAPQKCQLRMLVIYLLCAPKGAQVN